MRVVIISDFGSVNGGAAKVAIESARGLAEAGVEIVFACAIGPVSEQLCHRNIEVALCPGEDIWKVGSKVAAARQGIWNTAAYNFLTELLARQPVDTLVHLHQWTKAFSPAAIGAAGASGLPVAITMHDYFSFCPVGGYFDFRLGAPCQQKPMSVGCIASNCDRASYVHKLVRVARQWNSDDAMRSLKAPLFIHVSDFARQFAEPFLPKQARHVVVENMVETEKLPPASVAANEHALFLGRFTEEKGVLVAAEAAREAGMPLRLVGDGDARIKAEIARLNPDAVISGWIPVSAVVGEIRAARCLVAPSLWYETGPLTVIEAMAHGVPPVLSRAMGATERVRDGETGLVMAEPTVSAVAAGLRAFADGEQAARLGRAAHAAYWSAPLTLERHVARLRDAYRRSEALAA